MAKPQTVQAAPHPLRGGNRLQSRKGVSNGAFTTVIDDDDCDNSDIGVANVQNFQKRHSNGLIKRPYTELDKLSVRIGTTLKRYPMARIFVLVYMVSSIFNIVFVTNNMGQKFTTILPSKLNWGILQH